MRFSTYNLYLVYLALLDLLFCSYSIWEYRRYTNQTFDPSLYVTIAVSSPSTRDANTPRDEPIFAPYMFANMWINAVICHQVLVLLRTSYSARRIRQPSLTKVNLQAGGVCCVAFLLGVCFYYLYEPAWKARNNNGDFAKLEKLNRGVKPVLVCLGTLVPFGYVVYVAVLIRYKGYLPSAAAASPRKKALRELALYFFRIVAVFVGIWLPRGIFVYIADFSESSQWADLIAQLVVGIQPILTTCLVMTKSDAKRYILDLVTVSYLFGDSNDFGCCYNTKPSESESPKQEGATPRVDSVPATGTGFSCDADADGDGDADVAVDENRDENRDAEEAADRDDNEALDSLIFSVLGFRPSDSPGGGSSDAESVFVNNGINIHDDGAVESRQ